MVNIPRFNAQIQPLQVPTMKDYQAEQNASIAQSLARFGSDLMHGAMNAKKDKDSKYNELLQEGKTLSGRDDTVEKKKNEQAVQESFNTSFYNDALTTLSDIAETNRDNPAEIEYQSNAYIEGVVSDMPEQQQQSIRDSLNYLKDAWSKQSLDMYNDRQIAGAKDEIIANMANAQGIAISAMQQRAPDEIQIATSMNYFQNVHKAKESGQITAAEEVKLIESFGQDIIVNHLGDILNDPSMSAKEQLAWVRKFADGKTGDTFIDSVMSPTERMNAVNMAINNINQLQAFEKKMKGEQDELAEDNWKNFYVESKKLAYNTKDFYQLQKMQNRLVATAKTPEQLNLATSFISSLDKPTNQLAKVEFDKALRNGVLSQEALDVGLQSGVLSADDYTKYSESLSQPLARNKKTDTIQVVLAQARKAYGYTPFGVNNALDAFSANLDAKISGSIMTDAELRKAAEDAFAETDKLYPNAKQKTVQRIEDFNRSNGVGVEEVQKQIEESSREIAAKIAGAPNKVTGEIMAKAQRQALLNIAGRWMRENNKTKDEFNKFVQEYLEITGGQ